MLAKSEHQSCYSRTLCIYFSLSLAEVGGDPGSARSSDSPKTPLLIMAVGCFLSEMVSLTGTFITFMKSFLGPTFIWHLVFATCLLPLNIVSPHRCCHSHCAGGEISLINLPGMILVIITEVSIYMPARLSSGRVLTDLVLTITL